MSDFTNVNTSRTKPHTRRHRPKIEKSSEEFKEHEGLLMNKRNAEVNNAVTKKCHQLWNQWITHKPKPNDLQFRFVYHNIGKYLSVCDTYEPSQHKDPKQKWWNNQKASEMSQGFLPSILSSTDQMAEYMGQQMGSTLQTEFAHYCTFELLETAVLSVFSTMRSGSNEVFLRTSFQYSKANLRKKLESYFDENELQRYDLKMRKKKDLWSKLIKEKKEMLLRIFIDKKNVLFRDEKELNELPPSVMSVVHSDNISCSTNQTGQSTLPPINWSETSQANPLQYQPFQSIPLSAPYHQTINNGYYYSNTNHNNYMSQAYGSHRQCVDCLNYMNKMSEILNLNHKLQQEKSHLVQLNREYISDRQKYRTQYQRLLNTVNNNDNGERNTNNWTTMDNNPNASVAWI